MKRIVTGMLAACVALALFCGCGNSATAHGGTVKLILGAYSTPRVVYARLIPTFEAQWKQQTGQTVVFEQSYLGSGAQSRAIINGFQADVAALSLAPDVNAIAKAGLITHDWTNTPTKGMVSTSIVAFAVRKGNPKGIHDWADLARPGVQILTPDPKSSGGAQWNILALYGAALRGHVRGVAQGDANGAFNFLKAVLKNVTAMDKDAQTSLTNFEQGVGDVAITYESGVLAGQQAGQDYELVIPTSTILIQNPAAVVDAYANRHGTLRVANAFVTFLMSAQAQQVFAQNGYRPLDAGVARAVASTYPPVTDLWTIDYLGGWKTAASSFFGTTGIYIRAISAVQGA